MFWAQRFWWELPRMPPRGCVHCTTYTVVVFDHHVNFTRIVHEIPIAVTVKASQPNQCILVFAGRNAWEVLGTDLLTFTYNSVNNALPVDLLRKASSLFFGLMLKIIHSVRMYVAGMITDPFKVFLALACLWCTTLSHLCHSPPLDTQPSGTTVASKLGH